MRIVSVPGLNGLGKTKGCEKSFVQLGLKGEKIELNGEDIVSQLEDIKKESEKYFDSEKKVCFFGGDHSISYPLVLNFFKKFGGDSKLLVFDAHPDLMEAMPEPGHEEWLRAIVEEGFNPENVLIVGVRKEIYNIDKKEFDYALEKGIKIIYSDEFENRREEILEFVENGKVYCSFDVDVFDSSIVSCTTYPEENGLGELEVLELLEEISSKISFFDIVEVNFEKGSEGEREKGKRVVGEVLRGF